MRVYDTFTSRTYRRSATPVLISLISPGTKVPGYHMPFLRN